MKTKSFLLGAAAILLATACSNDEVVKVAENGAPIGFSSFINKSTRATDNTTENLENFSVYGLTKAQGADASVDATVLFKNQLVTKTNGVWGYTPEQYWIPGFDYTFAAVAPAAAATVEQGADMLRGGIQYLSFTNEDGKTDLLYDDDVVVNEGEDPKSDVKFGDTYTFNFGHILSRVMFQFKNGLSKGHTIIVKNVTISGADQAAKYTPSTEKWSEASGKATYKFDFDGTEVENKKYPSEVVSTDNAKTQPSYLIPTEGNRAFNVTFDVEVLVEDAKTGALAHLNDYQFEAELTNIELVKGFSYLFKTDITKETLELEPIKFSAEVSEWTPAVDSDFTYTEKETPSEGGETNN